MASNIGNLLHYHFRLSLIFCIIFSETELSNIGLSIEEIADAIKSGNKNVLSVAQLKGLSKYIPNDVEVLPYLFSYYH